MDKINLDITKYSCNELQEIFNINNIASSDQIDGHFNTYKNTILTDQTLSLQEKDNITTFLNKVITKLGSSLDKTGGNLSSVTSSFSNLSFSSPLNNLVKGTSDNHPIIANQNSIAGMNAKTYEGRNVDSKDFPPGYINPINIKTIRKTVNVDTRFREPYYATKSSDFSVQLPEQFKKVVSMRLSSFELPTSIYAISKSLGNNYFHINESCVDLSDGNYETSRNKQTTSMPAAHISNALNTHLQSISDCSFSIDQISGKSKVTIQNGKTLYFNKMFGNDSGYDLDNPLPLKLGWLLGFRAGSYESNSGSGTTVIESEGLCSLVGPKYIYICINDYTNAGNNNFTAAFSSSTLSPNIIARINLKAISQNIIYSNENVGYCQDDDFNDIHTRTREYFGPVDIQKLHFQILDEYGRVVEFNNMDWSCALTFDVLYD